MHSVKIQADKVPPGCMRPAAKLLQERMRWYRAQSECDEADLSSFGQLTNSRGEGNSEIDVVFICLVSYFSISLSLYLSIFISLYLSICPSIYIHIHTYIYRYINAIILTPLNIMCRRTACSHITTYYYILLHNYY